MHDGFNFIIIYYIIIVLFADIKFQLDYLFITTVGNFILIVI